MSDRSPSRLRTALRQKLQYLKAAVIDLRLLVTGKRDPELPPLRLRFVGMGDFRAIGEGLRDLLISTGGLRPTDHVLDIGCGVGRVAIPLAQYLVPGSTYDGFDVVRSAIRWCRNNISRRFPHFRFVHANLYNSFYNRRGVPASRYRFPYDDRSFDFAFATSVFTHLDVEAARNYLDEANRVLRPGGRLLATFFILGGAQPGLDFRYHRDGYALVDEATPDAAIAYEEPKLLEMLPADRWRIVRIERGAWSGRSDAPTYQDTVVVERA